MRTRGEWSRLLMDASNAGLAGTAFETLFTGPSSLEERRLCVASFADDAGHRRPVDVPFLSTLLKVACESAAENSGLDVRAWAMLNRNADDFMSIIRPGVGPLTEELSGPIEAWTECELSVLHALWNFGVQSGSRPAKSRSLAACRWLIENIQADNATNHPWSIHVFAELSVAESNAEAALYAEGLLHSATVSRGKPGVFSALILGDGARVLTSEGAPQKP